MKTWLSINRFTSSYWSIIALSLCLALFTAGAASAEDNMGAIPPALPASPVSSFSQTLKHFTADYLGVYYGGALNDLGGKWQPDVHGDNLPNPSAPQELENFLSVYYRLTDVMKVGMRMHFFYTPIVDTVPIGSTVVNQNGATMYDPLVQLSDSNIYSKGDFRLGGYLRAYLPLTQESQNIDRIFQIRAFANLSYDVTSKLTIGSYLYFMPAWYGSDPRALGNATTLLYAGPNLSYAILKNVQLTMLYELESSKTKGTDSNIFSNPYTDLEPGLNWDITPTFSLTPYLNFYPGNSFCWDSTNINMFIVWKFF